MRSATTLATATLAAICLMASTALADSHLQGFGGYWSGAANKERQIELTITHIDEDGNAFGLYCNVRPNGIWFADLHPEHGAIKAQVSKGVLKFRIRKIKFTFAPDEDDPDSMHSTRQKSGQKRNRELSRVDAEDADCLSRVTPLPNA